MDNAIWILTAALHLVILAAITIRWIRLPWFTTTIAFGLLESYFLYLVLLRGSAWDYYYAYYLADILNVGLYFLTIRECRDKPKYELISFSMMVYLVPKFASYAAMALNQTHAALLIQRLLRPLNIGCLLAWAVLLTLYAESASQSRLGDFMEPIIEDEECGKEPIHEEHPDRDPGATPPSRPSDDPGATPPSPPNG